MSASTALFVLMLIFSAGMVAEASHICTKAVTMKGKCKNFQCLDSCKAPYNEDGYCTPGSKICICSRHCPTPPPPPPRHHPLNSPIP
ncbi:hypothetical protein CASFOL_021724 [Castilleja foliolosa]|uniref:Defensin n=1 Tax=Castilleja foliolosa TaxID=1961234 RepID=A0ABD3CXD7_9LAMI